jgi:hypothetical protein
VPPQAGGDNQDCANGLRCREKLEMLTDFPNSDGGRPEFGMIR